MLYHVNIKIRTTDGKEVTNRWHSGVVESPDETNAKLRAQAHFLKLGSPNQNRLVEILQTECLPISTARATVVNFFIPVENTDTDNKIVQIYDDEDTLCILSVKNYDDKFADALAAANEAWGRCDDEWHDVVYQELIKAGYVFDVIDAEYIQVS